MKNYLITGGCGFLGSNIASALLAKGCRVVLLDNLSRVGSAENLNWLRTLGRPEFIHGSSLEVQTLRDTVAAARPDAIFHLAGQVAMTTSLKDPVGDFRTNVEGTINLLETVRHHAPEAAFIFSSSNKVYGALDGVRLVESSTRYEAPEHPAGINESQSLDFRTPYGCSKGAADQYVLEYARTYGLNTAVFRHSTIYGGRQRSTFDQGWVGWFCMQALAQKANPASEPFTISGNGKQVRDLLYVSDAVSCYLAASERINCIKGHAFNIGGGSNNSCSLLELFDVLRDILGVSLNYRCLDWRHEDQRFFVADNSKIESMLGWLPVVSKNDGVEKTLRWIAEGMR
jgi:CDP-paratose 2-epimerase